MIKDQLLEDFVRFVEKAKSDVEYVQDELQQRLSDEPGELIQQLEQIEAWTGRIGFILADAEAYLDRAKWAFLELPDVQSIKTAMDRKMALDAKVTQFRTYRDHVEVLANAIKNRCMVSLGILKFMRQVPDGNPGNTGNPGQLQAQSLSSRLY